MKLPFLAVTALLATTTLNAQDNPVNETSKKIELKSISVNLGFNDSEGAYSTIDDISTIAPGFMLRKDVSDYTHNNYNYSTNAEFSIQGDFEIKGLAENIAKYNPKLKLGLQYTLISPIDHNYSKTTTTTIDSLLYQNSQISIPLNEKKYEYYDITYSAEVISIDAALLLQTNPVKRLSFFTGIEASLGKSIKSEVIETIHTWSKSTDDALVNEFPYFSHNGELEVFSLEAHDLFYASLKIPLGLSFRVGKAVTDPLYPLHLNATLNPGVAMAAIKKFDSYSEAFLGAQIGITVDL